MVSLAPPRHKQGTSVNVCVVRLTRSGVLQRLCRTDEESGEVYHLGDELTFRVTR
jgi:hypothetical protein